MRGFRESVRLSGRHDAGAIAVLHAHAIGLRQPVDPLDDPCPKLAVRQHRAAALAAWAAEPLVDRVDADLGKLAGAIVAGGGEILPELGVRDVALLAVAGASVEEVGRCCVAAEAEALIGRGGKEWQRLVLHDQVADRIKDRLALVELDSERRMRAVADEDIGAGIDRQSREGAGEIRGLGELALSLGRDEAGMAIFVAVEVEHDPIGLPARLPDPAQIVLDVGLVAFARDLEAVAAHEGFVQQRDRFRALGANLAVAEEMLALARTFLLEAKLATDALELIEGFAVDRVGVLEAEWVDAGATA